MTVPPPHPLVLRAGRLPVNKTIRVNIHNNDGSVVIPVAEFVIMMYDVSYYTYIIIYRLTWHFSGPEEWGRGTITIRRRRDNLLRSHPATV